MTPSDPDIHTALQRLDRALTPAPVLATKAVERYYGRGQATPWINRHDDKGAPTLDTDTVLSHDHHDRRLGRKV